MDIFYSKEIRSSETLLDPIESGHCIRVLRYKRGDKIQVIDGSGIFFTAEILEENPKACSLRIIESKPDAFPMPYELHIAIAPTKNIDRFEWFVEKSTEMGISSITPILCERSERKQLRIDRLEKVIISAMKQSHKALMPTIEQLTPINIWLARKHDGARYFAHCMESKKESIHAIGSKEKYTLMIGPEGDFTPAELNQAIDSGFNPLSLGKYRLRTETAGVYACAAISLINMGK